MNHQAHAVIEVELLPGEKIGAACQRLFGSPFGPRTKLPPYLPIDKNIPIPEAARPGWKGFPPFRAPWFRMDVGDSVMIPGKSPADAHRLLRSPIQRYGFRFRTRLVDGGCRVWRVA